MITDKILIVTPYFPYPINSGGSQAQFHMIDFLRNHIDISLAYTYTPGKQANKYQKELQELWPDVTFYPFAIQRNKFLFRKCKKLLKAINSWPDEDTAKVQPALSYSFERNIDYEFVNYLDAIIHENKIELMQFEFPVFQNFSYAFPNIKKVFVQHEIQFIRSLRFLKNLQNLPPCDIYQYKMLKTVEIAAMQECDAIIVLTEIDKQILLNEQITSPIFVSPAIIPLPSQQTFKRNNPIEKLIFLGGSDHKPNFEGLMWFLESAWKYILDEQPSIKLQVIGKWQHRFMRDINSNYKNVEFTGYIPKIEPYLENAIMIVPILTGSGMRMKIIDAANYGIPFITTAIGVEGLDFENNEDCFIENDALPFAKKTIELLTSTSLQEKFTLNALEKIKCIYPTKKLLAKRLEIYHLLLDK